MTLQPPSATPSTTEKRTTVSLRIASIRAGEGPDDTLGVCIATWSDRLRAGHVQSPARHADRIPGAAERRNLPARARAETNASGKRSGQGGGNAGAAQGGPEGHAPAHARAGNPGGLAQPSHRRGHLQASP